MAAYAALVSVMHIIEQIQHHPRPPITLDKNQVESLTEKVTLLQDILEGHYLVGNEEADRLESRITDVAYAAEDVIESHAVDQILDESTSHGETIRSIDLYQSLQKVIEDMDLIKNEVLEIKETSRVQDQLRRISISAGSSRSPPTGQNIMVGFDDVLIEMMHKLTGQQSNRQIVPIVGMGGIGKTTLARNIYVSPLIMHHFDIRAWSTISQEYSVLEILLDLLLCLKTQESRENLSKSSEEQLGIMLHQSLSRRRYLIIMDDIWSITVWEKVMLYFPDNGNGSRIIVTTRLSNVAFQLAERQYCLEIKLLDEVKSWNLLCKTVFGDRECCPVELEETGKKMAKNCKGLPLSIVVIGGVLTKSKQTQTQTREYWEYIAKNLSSIVNLEDDEHCLKILQMSYNQLSVHLKPCFLYMGVFSNDSMIRVSWLIKLWIAEGFLKPNSEKSIEVVAEEYLQELIDRNLILVSQRKSNGKIKSCNMHDLLWDMCSKQAQKEKFYCVIREQTFIQQNMNNQRRIGIHRKIGPEVRDSLLSASLARSLIICDLECRSLPSLSHRLLRVLKATDEDLFYDIEDKYTIENIFQLVNSRFLAIPVDRDINLRFPSFVCLLWNIQTLIVKHEDVIIAPSEIWAMPQLRHVEFDALELPDPRKDDVVLKNLQTLSIIINFRCGEEVVKRIPNIKKLKLIYYGSFEDVSDYCLHNLHNLNELESLSCSFDYLESELSSDRESMQEFDYPETDSSSIREMLQHSESDESSSHRDLMQEFDYPESELSNNQELVHGISFPCSLKKLSLEYTWLRWEDMIMTKIGSLPHLEVLILDNYSFIGQEWETVGGQFCCLKFLQISGCCDLERWMTDSCHFPCLEHLILQNLDKLEEIPSAIGDIPTLQLIELGFCSDSAVISAKEIVEEQEQLGNECLQVRVLLGSENEELESLRSPNFIVQ